MDRRLYPKKNTDGTLSVDQGCVEEYPVTWNPDDGYFYLHDKNTNDGTGVIARRRDWRNITLAAKTNNKKTEAI
jgi:hypothetical protein